MTDEAMSPLRRRMIEDMTIRKFAPKSQHDTCTVATMRFFFRVTLKRHRRSHGENGGSSPSGSARNFNDATISMTP